MRDHGLIGLEAVAQSIEVRQSAGIKIGVDRMREFGLTGAVMSERKQADHGAAGLLLALLGQQRLECAGISAAREQLIAIDQIEQRHRFLAQRMDDVMIVDDVAVLAAPLRRPTTPQGQELRGAEEAVEPVVVEVNIETVADQTRRNAVEHAPQDEAAARRDQDASLLIVGGSSVGEWLERGALDLDALAVPGIAPPDHLVDEAAIGGEIARSRASHAAKARREAHS